MRRGNTTERSPSPPRRMMRKSYNLRVVNPEKALAKRKQLEDWRRKEAEIMSLIEDMLRPDLPPRKMSKDEEEFYRILAQVLDENAKEGFETKLRSHRIGEEHKINVMRSINYDGEEELDDEVVNSVLLSRNPSLRPNPLYSQHLKEMLIYREMSRRFLKEFNLVYLFENVYLSRGPIRNFEPEDCVCVTRCDENCLNRITKTECVRCHIGENCGNDKFHRRRWVPTEIRKAGLKGHGLYTKEFVKKGSFVIEYVGEILDGEQLLDRKEKYQRHCYFFSLGNDLAIDASLKGNQARFMNHSCDPNLEPQKWMVDGEFRIGFFAVRDIPEGTELSFDYAFETFTEYKQQCLCGAKNCRGYITSKQEREQMEDSEIKVLEAVSPTDQLKEVELSNQQQQNSNYRQTPKRGRNQRKKKKSPPNPWEGVVMKQTEICNVLVNRFDKISKRLKPQKDKEEEEEQKVEDEDEDESVQERDEDEDDDRTELINPDHMKKGFILRRNLKRGILKRILQVKKMRKIVSQLPPPVPVPPPPPPPQHQQEQQQTPQNTQQTPQDSHQQTSQNGPPVKGIKITPPDILKMKSPLKVVITRSTDGREEEIARELEKSILRSYHRQMEREKREKVLKEQQRREGGGENDPIIEESSDSEDEVVEVLSSKKLKKQKKKKANLSPRELRQFERSRSRDVRIEKEDEIQKKKKKKRKKKRRKSLSRSPRSPPRQKPRSPGRSKSPDSPRSPRTPKSHEKDEEDENITGKKRKRTEEEKEERKVEKDEDGEGGGDDDTFVQNVQNNDEEGLEPESKRRKL